MNRLALAIPLLLVAPTVVAQIRVNWKDREPIILRASSFSHNGKLAASDAMGRVLLIDGKSGEIQWQTQPFGRLASGSARISNDGTRILAIGDGMFNSSHFRYPTLRLYDELGNLLAKYPEFVDPMGQNPWGALDCKISPTGNSATAWFSGYVGAILLDEKLIPLGSVPPWNVFTRDGKYLVCSEVIGVQGNQYIAFGVVFDASTGVQVSRFALPNHSYPAQGPTGSTATFWNETTKKLEVRDIFSGNVVHTIAPPLPISEAGEPYINFGPDAETCTLIQSKSRTLYRWKYRFLTNSFEDLKLENTAANQMWILSPDGDTLARSISRYDPRSRGTAVETALELKRFGESSVYFSEFVPNQSQIWQHGDSVAVQETGDTLHVRDARNGQTIYSVGARWGTAHAISDRWLIRSPQEGYGTGIIVTDLKSGESRSKIGVPISILGYVGEGDFGFVQYKGKPHVIDFRTLALREFESNFEVFGSCVSVPQTDLFLMLEYGERCSIDILDSKLGRVVRRLGKVLPNNVMLISVSPSGRMALAAEINWWSNSFPNGTRHMAIYVVDLETGRLVQKLDGHEAGTTGGVFTTDNTLFTTGCRGDLIKWDVESGRNLVHVQDFLGDFSESKIMGASSDGSELYFAHSGFGLKNIVAP